VRGEEGSVPSRGFANEGCLFGRGPVWEKKFILRMGVRGESLLIA